MDMTEPMLLRISFKATFGNAYVMGMSLLNSHPHHRCSHRKFRYLNRQSFWLILVLGIFSATLVPLSFLDFAALVK